MLFKDGINLGLVIFDTAKSEITEGPLLSCAKCFYTNC